MDRDAWLRIPEWEKTDLARVIALDFHDSEFVARRVFARLMAGVDLPDEYGWSGDRLMS